MNTLKASANILLIDDDDVDVLHIKYSLKELGIAHHLYVAKSGIIALNMLKGEKDHAQMPQPDLILLDINMPKMNGFQFLNQLKNEERFGKIPIVIVSTSSAPNDLEKATNANIAAYFIKPVNLKEFMNVYQRLVLSQPLH